jgi:hypothetical protein
MAQAKKIYAGSGKKKSDTWFSISINMDKIQDYIQEYNGTKFVKLNVNVNAKPDQYGKDVSVSVDTYEPNKSSNGSSGSRQAAPAPRNAPASTGYVPFTEENTELPF